jgi:hypothetical protein
VGWRGSGGRHGIAEAAVTGQELAGCLNERDEAAATVQPTQAPANSGAQLAEWTRQLPSLLCGGDSRGPAAPDSTVAPYEGELVTCFTAMSRHVHHQLRLAAFRARLSRCPQRRRGTRHLAQQTTRPE